MNGCATNNVKFRKQQKLKDNLTLISFFFLLLRVVSFYYVNTTRCDGLLVTEHVGKSHAILNHKMYIYIVASGDLSKKMNRKLTFSVWSPECYCNITELWNIGREKTEKKKKKKKEKDTKMLIKKKDMKKKKI